MGKNVPNHQPDRVFNIFSTIQSKVVQDFLIHPTATGKDPQNWTEGLAAVSKVREETLDKEENPIPLRKRFALRLDFFQPSTNHLAEGLDVDSPESPRLDLNVGYFSRFGSIAL